MRDTGRGRKSTTPEKNKSRLEWKPVDQNQKETHTDRDRHQRSKEKSVVRNLEHSERRAKDSTTPPTIHKNLSLGKEVTTTLGTYQLTNAHSSLGQLDNNINNNKVLSDEDMEDQENDREAAKKGRDKTNEEELPLYTEEEMDKFAEEYAGTEMDEDMIADDDLLDELEVEKEVGKKIGTEDHVPKRQEDPLTKSTNGEQNKRKPVLRRDQETRAGTKEHKDGSKAKVPTGQSKRRGLRSLDSKGTLASKKLAVRGRASPKGKLVRSSRAPIERSSTSHRFPPNEVYPSSMKNKRSSAASGLVGFQNPPNPQI